MDSLHIKGLAVNTHIGIHDWEQRINQRLLLDITIPCDFRDCQDSISNTIDYDRLCHDVTAFIEGKSFKLIETVANDVALLIKSKFNANEVTVAVSKGQVISNAADVRVSVTR